jgi:hypothetical protein
MVALALGEFSEREADFKFMCETNGKFDGVICRPFKEEDENLKHNNFMGE